MKTIQNVPQTMTTSLNNILFALKCKENN